MLVGGSVSRLLQVPIQHQVEASPYQAQCRALVLGEALASASLQAVHVEQPVWLAWFALLGQVLLEAVRPVHSGLQEVPIPCQPKVLLQLVWFGLLGRALLEVER